MKKGTNCLFLFNFTDIFCSVRTPWYNNLLSYNPAVHRTKQALFHCAVVSDISSNPLPPPHPELVKYFDPPKRVLKRARDAIDECRSVFKVKQGKLSERCPTPFTKLLPFQFLRKLAKQEKMDTYTPKMKMKPFFFLIASVPGVHNRKSK